jgi:DNA sulfur modification protein DndC
MCRAVLRRAPALHLPSIVAGERIVRENGDASHVLGTRKAESQRRARTMAAHDRRRVRERLTPNASLPNSLVYTPIEDWSNDDVWLFLMQYKNLGGIRTSRCWACIRGPAAAANARLVAHSSAPSCGTSRFGCWVRRGHRE